MLGRPHAVGRALHTHSRASFARTSTGPRRSNGARDSVSTIFARGTDGARRTLQARREAGGEERASTKGRLGRSWGWGGVLLALATLFPIFLASQSWNPTLAHVWPRTSRVASQLSYPPTSLSVNPCYRGGYLKAKSHSYTHPGVSGSSLATLSPSWSHFCCPVRPPEAKASPGAATLPSSSDTCPEPRPHPKGGLTPSHSLWGQKDLQDRRHPGLQKDPVQKEEAKVRGEHRQAPGWDMYLLPDPQPHGRSMCSTLRLGRGPGLDIS